MKAQEILSYIKDNKEASLVIMNDQGEILANKDTTNLQDIYSTGESYGVYGDVVNGQVDSRNEDDEVILKQIEKALMLGTVINRNDLPESFSTFTYEEFN